MVVVIRWENRRVKRERDDGWGRHERRRGEVVVTLLSYTHAAREEDNGHWTTDRGRV